MKRKTFISDAYAARQARYAQLGVAVIQSPMKHIKGAVSQQIEACTKEKVILGEDAYYASLDILARFMRRALRMAKDGYGRGVKFVAREVHNYGGVP